MIAVSFTHLRVRDTVQAAIVAQRQFDAGTVVALDDLDFEDYNYEAIMHDIATTGNQHRVLEAGSLEDGAFVTWEPEENPAPKPRSRSTKPAGEKA